MKTPESPTGDADEKHVTRRELGQELRAFRNEMRVLLIAVAAFIRFDLPKELTAAALAAVVAKAAWTFTVGRFTS